MNMQAEPEIVAYQDAPIIERIAAGAALAVMAAAAAFVAYFDPAKASFFPLCPLYSMTGFACPGCGLTRGFHELFHGRLIPALDFNLLIPVWVAIFGWAFVSLSMYVVRGRGLPMWPTRPRFLWTFLITLLAFGIVRNIPAWPFTILFP